MAIGKPPILSRQPVLTEYFTKGAVFVDHTVDSIVDGIRRHRSQESRLTEEIVELAEEKRRLWNVAFCELVELLSED